jgi:prefoldin subunit 5
MNGMKVPLAIVMAIAIQAGAMLWYVSGIDHRVSTMYVEYQKSNQKAVIENQVRMEMDLQQVVKAVVGMGSQVMVNKEATEILIEQNEFLKNQTKSLKKQINTLKKQFTTLKKAGEKKKKKQTDKKLG